MTKSYLNKKDLENFKSSLLQIRKNIISNEHGKVIDDISTEPQADTLDMIANENYMQLQVRMANIGKENIYDVEEALERIEDGTYGYCEMSGEEIGKKRLEIYPTAKYCVKVQEIMDKKENNNN